MPMVTTALANGPGTAASLQQDWMISKTEFREPEEVVSRVLATRVHRLVLKAVYEKVSEGSNLRLLLSVERFEWSDESIYVQLLNPFTNVSFPRNMIVAVYNEDGEFVDSFPSANSDSGSPEDQDDFNSICLKHGETRGKYVNVTIGPAANSRAAFFLPLKQGTYRFQLIASGRFFMGNFFDKEDTRPFEEKWRAISKQEGKRSDVVTIHVTADPVPAIVPQSDDDDLKLLATVELVQPVDDETSMSPEYPYMLYALTNCSRSRSIGIIEPFLGRCLNLLPPNYWVIAEKSSLQQEWKRSWNSRESTFSSAWPPDRSSFVILPPDGFASRRMPGASIQEGEYEVSSVGLIDAIVTDPDKLEILRTGDTEVGYKLGGADAGVIHPDSVLTKHFIVK